MLKRQRRRSTPATKPSTTPSSYMQGLSVAEITDKLREKRRQEMNEKGQKFATFLPDYHLIGVDPGYLFAAKYGSSISLPEFVVDHLLELLT